MVRLTPVSLLQVSGKHERECILSDAYICRCSIIGNRSGVVLACVKWLQELGKVPVMLLMSASR